MRQVATTVHVLENGFEYDTYLAMRARVWGVEGHPSNLDGYDRRALVFGAVGVGGRLEAALRLVMPGDRIAGFEPLRQAAVRQGFGGERCLELPTPCRISAEESFPMASLLDELDRSHGRYAEIGRLMKSEAQQDPWSAIRLVKDSLQEAGRRGFHLAFAMCAESHVRPWQRYGFERVPGMPVQTERYSGRASVLVWVRLNDQPAHRSTLLHGDARSPGTLSVPQGRCPIPSPAAGAGPIPPPR